MTQRPRASESRALRRTTRVPPSSPTAEKNAHEPETPLVSCNRRVKEETGLTSRRLSKRLDYDDEAAASPVTRRRRSRCAECSAMASREPQRRSGAGPVSRDAAAAPVRARTTIEQRSVSTALWCRGISLVILILGFVVGVLYASAKMRFVEDVLPKISGTRLRGPANVSRALPRRPRAPAAPRASTRPAFSFPLRSISQTSPPTRRLSSRRLTARPLDDGLSRS